MERKIRHQVEREIPHKLYAVCWNFLGRDVQCILHVSKKGFRVNMVELLIYWQA